MMTLDRPRIAFFRPDDERAANAQHVIESLDAIPVSDPMLEITPTGAQPREDADYLILTSRTGVALLDRERITTAGSIICAIGEATAQALRAAGVEVDVIPTEFTSTGLVDRLSTEVAGATIEVARSDHGSPVLIDGLVDAGAYVHETVLYELTRPVGAGDSAEMVAHGSLDALLFTSSLTVEHFVDAAANRGILRDVRNGLDDLVVGTIGAPTRDTAREHEIPVDVVASRASFDALAREVRAEVERSAVP